MLLRKSGSDLESEIRRLRAQVIDLEGEVTVLRAQLEDGDIPAATRWLQTKVWRQRVANSRLVYRNTTLRFALRLMNTIREPVTTEEWVKARDAIADEKARKRVDEQAPVS